MGLFHGSLRDDESQDGVHSGEDGTDRTIDQRGTIVQREG